MSYNFGDKYMCMHAYVMFVRCGVADLCGIHAAFAVPKPKRPKKLFILPRVRFDWLVSGLGGGEARDL